jgi:cyclohexa-1,5-dienecarbonyl-CoA hydratase
VWHENDEQVLRIALDAPPGNVLDLEMIGSLRRVLAGPARQPQVKAIVFSGTGAHFSYGASIEEHLPEKVGALLPAFHGLFRDLLDVARPTLAVVRGRCLGGGLELASFCNWMFAAPDAQLGVPEVTLGVFPPLAALILPQRVGRPLAEDLCLTGRIVGAEEARAIGLVDQVSEDPEAAARQWIARHLLPKSAVALHFTTRAVREPLHARLLADLDALERLYLQDLMQRADPREGIRAWIEKRQPQWKNE